MAYASRLYPRAKPRGFTLQWIKLMELYLFLQKCDAILLFH